MERGLDFYPPFMATGYDSSFQYRKACDVGSGAWVLVKCNIPVAEAVRPMTYGIYWAIPYHDKSPRQMCKIYTPHEVCLLNYEYTVIPPERLKEYQKMGYYLKDFGLPDTEPLNMKLLDRARNLVEEEREIIMALMLDGLTEQQACEEYYYMGHTDYENTGRCYLPNEETLNQIIQWFGPNGFCG